MTDQEIFMYSVINQLSLMKVPIVFKGELSDVDFYWNEVTGWQKR